MKVRDIMVTTPAYCSADTNLAAATEIFWNRNCGMLPIVDAENKVVGVVTDRDICIRLGTQNQRPGEIAVNEVASQKVFSCHPDDDIHTALDIMSRAKVRRLPVINHEGILQGVLSMDDVVRKTDAIATERMAELSHLEVVNTLRGIYGPLPFKPSELLLVRA
jgi:CBS domain-containing protein